MQLCTVTLLQDMNQAARPAFFEKDEEKKKELYDKGHGVLLTNSQNSPSTWRRTSFRRLPLPLLATQEAPKEAAPAICCSLHWLPLRGMQRGGVRGGFLTYF